MTSIALGSILVLMVVCVATGVAMPNKKEQQQQAKKTTTTTTPKPKCKACDDDYTPVCGHDPSTNKSLSFGNVCVMEKYNCENSKHLKKSGDGECPNGGGVRLS